MPNEKEGTSYENAWSLNVILGINKIELSNLNTTPSITSEDFSIAGITTGLAFGYQYRKIGAYLACGVDNPISKYGRNWNFKNKAWIGIGLGLGL